MPLTQVSSRLIEDTLRYVLGANGSSDYTFTGPGLSGAVNDPTLTLSRGHTYIFENRNSSGAHPFYIKTSIANGGTNDAYNTGVTNNGGAGGTEIVFTVPHDAPDLLYYQCSSHSSMAGQLKIAGAVADGSITTAKIADDAVTAAKIAANAIITSKLNNSSVTNDKIHQMAASKLTGALPAISGANLTNLPKSKNKVINGEMRVSQRGQSFANANNEYTLDRYRVNGLHDGAVTVTQDASAPPGFANSLKVDVTTADTSIGSGQYIQLTQRIEARNLQDLAYGTSGAKAITVSFWVKSNLTGTYTYSMQQTDNSAKQTSSQYTINTANTWEKKTFTFTGDVNGVIDNNNDTGINIYWNLAIGTQYTTGTPRSSWTTFSDPDFAAGHTANLLASTANEWYLTGVMIEIGSVATDFEHLSIQEELALCQRYYFVYADGEGGSNAWQLLNIHGYSTGQLETTIDYSWANLRAVPALRQGNGTNYYNAVNASASITFSAFTAIYQPSTRKALLYTNNVSGTTPVTGMAYRCQLANNNAYIHLDAEL